MITGLEDRGIDLALLCLWAFVIFFAGLVFYLHRESKREGYPMLEAAGDRTRRASVIGWPAPPSPKTYRVAGWAPVSEEAKDSGPAVWDVVANYLRTQKVITQRPLNLPTLKGMDGNPGVAV